MTRIDIATAEGTNIAVWARGDGPAILLVHGSMCDHGAFEGLVEELSDDFRVFAMDRRGFGDSPDSGAYSAEREYRDVARVTDAIAERTGEPVTVFGHSWGASCAMGGAALSRKVHRLVLYEPSFGLRYPEGFIERLEARVAAGDQEGAVLSVLVDLAGMTDEQVAERRASASWPDRLATAPTIAREARLEDEWVYSPGEFETISAPVLFIVGDQSPPDLKAITRILVENVTGAHIHTLEGHGHFAYGTDPSVVADAIREFAGSGH